MVSGLNCPFAFPYTLYVTRDCHGQHLFSRNRKNNSPHILNKRLPQFILDIGTGPWQRVGDGTAG